ncbi:MAG: hypothetical protein KJP00_02420 [Bacteroidia bacterium]|nr:hypothetical protein [Bacteroidia bacterium]
MYYILVMLVIGLFIAILFLNIYFRIKVLKVYKKLVQARVEFDAKDVFNMQYVEDEVIPKYPANADDIRRFMNHIRYSVRMAMILITLITILGAILMYYRHD